MNLSIPISNNRTITIPDISDTLLTQSNVATITNKTLISSIILNSQFTLNGTASQSGNTITGSGFTQSMIGGIIQFSTLQEALITGFVNSTTLTAAQSQTVASTTYTLYYGGVQADSSGSAGITNLYNNTTNYIGSTSGYVSLSAPSTVTTYSLTLPTTAASLSGQALTSTTGGILSWTTIPSTTTAIVNNGNSFGGPIVIGSNDANSLSFETNGQTYETISSSGQIDIGNNATTTSSNINLGTTTTSGNINIGPSMTTGVLTIGSTSQTGNIILGTSNTNNSVLIGNGSGSTTVSIGNNVGNNTINIANGVNTSPQTVNISSGANAANSTVNILTGTSTSGTQTLNLANGSTTKLINIGNTAGATAIVERVGTGNYSLDGVSTSTYSIGSSTTTGTITIGGVDQTGNITLGSSSGTNNILIGNGTGVTTVSIANASVAGNTVNIASTSNNVAQSVNISNGNSSANSTINLLSGAPSNGTQTFNLFTGVATGGNQIGNIMTGSGGTKTLNIGASGVTTSITGTTNLSSLTTNGALYLNSNTITSSALTNGQLLIGSTGTYPRVGSITSNASTISVTNGAGTINIDINTSGVNTMSSLTLTASSPTAALAFTGNPALTTSTNSYTIQSNSSLTLQSGSGINLGTSSEANSINIGAQSNAARNINIGTSAYSNTIDLGSSTSITAISGSTNFPGLSADGVLYLNGTGTLISTPLTNGQILIGSTSSTPVAATLTAGSGISITNAAGSITIAVNSSGTVTSFQTSLSGLTPATATTGAITLSGTLGIISGGTGATTFTAGGILLGNGTSAINTLADVATGSVLTSGGVGSNPIWTGFSSSPTANYIVSRDGNANTQINNTLEGYTSITTSGGTTTLTVASTRQQYFTGTNSQTVVMPVVTTLTLGQQFWFFNNSTGTITIQTSGTNTLTTLSTGQYSIITYIGNNGTGTASWYTLTGTSVLGVTSFTAGSTGLTPSTATTGAVTLAGTLNTSNGGTGTTTAPTSGQILVGTSGGTYAPYTLATSTGISTTTGSGTLQINNTGVTSFTAGTTGLTPSTSTTGGITLGGTLVVGNGGTGQTTFTAGSILLGNGTSAISSLADVGIGSVLTSGGTNTNPTWTSFTNTATQNTIMSRDTNANTQINNIIEGYTTTITAGSTTTLTISSTYLQYFTGSSNQTVLMPVTSTLVLGQQYEIVNNSTGTVTIESSGGNTIATLTNGQYAILTCIALTGTTASSWNVATASSSAGVTSFSAGTTGLIPSTPTSGAIVLSGILNTVNGGTGTTTAPTAGQILVGTSSNTYVPYTLSSGSGISTTTGSGTLQINNTGVTAFSAGTTGLTPSTTTTGSITLGGTLGVSNGGTGTTTLTAGGILLGNGTAGINVLADVAIGSVLTSGGTGSNPTWTGFSSSPTANYIVSRDGNGNTQINNILEGYTSTVTSGATTTLTVASTRQQYFTGTSNQAVAMPVVSTLVLGQQYWIVNNSTGTITIQSSGGNTITTLSNGQYAILTCISLTGTTASSWSTQGSNFILNGGNSFGSAISIGSNDANSLSFQTNGQIYETISSTGQIDIGNNTTTTSSNINIGTTTTTGNITIGKVLTSGTITIGGSAQTGTITLGQSSGTNTIYIAGGAGTNTIVVGANTSTNTIGIGSFTGSTNTITIGNTNSTTGITARIGTGNFSLDGVGASIYNIGASTTTGSISIGGSAQTGNLSIGSSSATNTVNIGYGAGTTTINLGTGIAGNSINIGTGANTTSQSINIASGNSAANSTVNIFNGTATSGTQTVNLMTGSGGTKLVNIGASGVTTGITGTFNLPSLTANGALYLNSNTVTSGTLSVSNGGTGQTTFTAGSLVLGNGSSTLTSLADVATGSVLISGGVGANPSWTSYSNIGTSSATANTLVARDANANTQMNNTIEGYTIIITSGSTTTLTIASSRYQYFAGTSNQTAVMPTVSGSIPLGLQFWFLNNSTGTITIQTSGGNTLTTLSSGQYSIITYIGNNGTGTASWYTVSGSSSLPVTSFSTGTTGLTPSTATNGAVTLAGTLVTGNGGTGTSTSPTSGQILVGTSGGSYVPYTLATGTGISTTTGSGTLQINNTGVTSFTAGTTGLTPSTSTNGAVTLAGTLNTGNGGTGQTTFTTGSILLGNGSGALSSLADVATGSVLTSGGTNTNPNWTGFTAYNTTAASTIVSRDPNSNTQINNLIDAYTTTATTGGTTTLTVASTKIQSFTGTNNQTVVLPVTSTLVTGQQYQIINNSTGTVTVQSSGGNTINTLAAGESIMVTCVSTSGTTAASWYVVQASQWTTSGNNLYYAPGGVAIGTSTQNSNTLPLLVQAQSGSISSFFLVNSDFSYVTSGSGIYMQTLGASGSVGFELQAFSAGGSNPQTFELNPNGGNVNIGNTSASNGININGITITNTGTTIINTATTEILRFTSAIVHSQPTPTNVTATSTLTIANLLTRIITGAPGGLATYTLTLPTATNAVAGIASLAAGDSIDFSVINTGVGNITLATNTGGSSTGSLTTGGGDSGAFRMLFTSVSSPAYTIYRIS